jgi:hypothetical protein
MLKQVRLVCGMPLYRIHRMKDGPQESFRWATHTGGLVTAKPKDYEAGEEIEGANPYEIWKRMSASAKALRPGDVLVQCDPESSSPQPMWIVKYIGFEPAQWFVAAPPPVEVVATPD